MTVNEKATGPKEEGVITSFRVPKLRRLMLEQIGKERGHSDLSTTLNEAVDQYIDGYLRRKVA